MIGIVIFLVFPVGAGLTMGWLLSKVFRPRAPAGATTPVKTPDDKPKVDGPKPGAPRSLPPSTPGARPKGARRGGRRR